MKCPRLGETLLLDVGVKLLVELVRKPLVKLSILAQNNAILSHNAQNVAYMSRHKPVSPVNDESPVGGRVVDFARPALRVRVPPELHA